MCLISNEHIYLRYTDLIVVLEGGGEEIVARCDQDRLQGGHQQSHFQLAQNFAAVLQEAAASV